MQTPIYLLLVVTHLSPNVGAISVPSEEIDQSIDEAMKLLSLNNGSPSLDLRLSEAAKNSVAPNMQSHLSQPVPTVASQNVVGTTVMPGENELNTKSNEKRPPSKKKTFVSHFRSSIKPLFGNGIWWFPLYKAFSYF
ncbi:unnamed protein product [Fasciola hepatica]|uniref:Uncharacterized protein n=1 Tax=Fasciola hepatica TaxID=6192 RepID=A0ABC9HIA6_FASHE